MLELLYIYPNWGDGFGDNWVYIPCQKQHNGQQISPVPNALGLVHWSFPPPGLAYLQTPTGDYLPASVVLLKVKCCSISATEHQNTQLLRTQPLQTLLLNLYSSQSSTFTMAQKSSLYTHSKVIAVLILVLIAF